MITTPANRSAPRPVTDYLLHRPPMLLIDDLIEVEGNSVVCEVRVRPESPFCDGALVPAWVGIEYMAQTVGVLAGYHSVQQGKPVEIGFLVGCRTYRNYVAHFEVGQTIRVHAVESLAGDTKIIAMDCALKNGGVLLAEAILLVYKPDDLASYLQQLDG